MVNADTHSEPPLKGPRMKNQMHILLAAIGVAAAIVGTDGAGAMQTGAPVEESSKPEPVLAGEIYGVRCRLRAGKYKWQASEIPQFKAYIFGQGNDGLWLATLVDQRIRIQVDGQWYRYAGPEWTGGVSRHGKAEWIAKIGGYLPVALDEHHWKAVRDSRPLELAPGEHSICLAWAGYKADPPSTGGHQKDENPILLVSEPVRIQIVKAPLRSGELTPDDQRRRQVRELFRGYLHREPSSAVEEKLGIRTDLRAFHNWYPVFQWGDIPALLELAENEQLLKGMPKLDVSSYTGGGCRQGMIALWFIEGLRRQQLSRVRQEQLGESQHPASSRLPLNPICVKEGVKLSECESSADIHRAALRAYQAWWRAVRDLLPGEAAVLYPLDLTDLQWFGGGERWREQPLRMANESSAQGTVAQRTVMQWIYVDHDYQAGKVLQTVYYAPKDPTAKPPFTRDTLVVQKVRLYFYDKEGKEIRTLSIVPLFK